VTAASETTERESAESAEKGRSILVDAWLVLSSQRTTAVLVIVLATFAGATAFLPQGRDALALAARPDATAVHQLAALGLLDVFSSPWVGALGALLAANMVAVLIRQLGAKRARALTRPPEGAPYRVELSAPIPERAVEVLREAFRIRLGAPERESVEGSKVTMLFDTSPRGKIAPMLAHVGLVVLIVGAGLLSEPPPENKSIVRAQLEVTSSETGTVGIFDMVSGEPFSFFQFPTSYLLQGYLPQKDGLGPAIRFERSLKQSPRQVEDFWIYKNAPPEFDKRHRRGEVYIRALKMGLVALPGGGLASSPAAILMVLGLSMLLLGAVASRNPEGQLWVEADGDRVRITGVPKALDDQSFEDRFSRWAHAATAVLRD
jgi:hypothetical protein